MELSDTHVQLDLSTVRIPTSSSGGGDLLTYSGTTTLIFSSTGSGAPDLVYCAPDDEGPVDNNDGDGEGGGADDVPPGTLIFGSQELACHWDSAAGVQVTTVTLKQGKKQLKVGKVESAADRAMRKGGSTTQVRIPSNDLHWISLPSGASFPVDMYGSSVELLLGFKAKVSTTAVEGIYSVGSNPFSSKENGSFNLPSMLVTQFEVQNARKAFPCLDFPFVKSRFSIAVNAFCPASAMKSVHSVGAPGAGGFYIPFFAGNNELTSAVEVRNNNSNNNNTGSNQGEGKRNLEKHSISFATVPTETKIPMYVASFVLIYSPMQQHDAVAGSKFPLVSPEDGNELTFSSTVDEMPLRVLALKSTPFPCEFSMKIMEHSLMLLTQFFQLPLSLRKLDLVVVPKMSLGGMEHEGLIYINETVATGSGRVGAGAGGKSAIEAEIARLIVHEVTHHWIGNWIGCPFAAKEGICQILEESIGDVVLGLPMRKRKVNNITTSAAKTKGGEQQQQSQTVSGGAGGTVEEGKELTGQTYQLALAATAEAVAVMGWSSFQETMASLVGQHYDTYVGWSVFRESLNL